MFQKNYASTDPVTLRRAQNAIIAMCRSLKKYRKQRNKNRKRTLCTEREKLRRNERTQRRHKQRGKKEVRNK
jgi:hypothetical protein